MANEKLEKELKHSSLVLMKDEVKGLREDMALELFLELKERLIKSSEETKKLSLEDKKKLSDKYELFKWLLEELGYNC